MTANRKLDLVTLEVIRNALPAISYEMSHVLQRTSYNMMIYEVRDYCCGILDTEGNLISQNIGGVSHFVADLGVVIKDGIKKYGLDGFHPGDVIVTNHQRVAGQHLNNVMLYIPFFFEDELFAFPTVRAHWVDIGGTSTGFGSMGARDPWMEGLQLDQIKVFNKGKVDESVWQLLKDNIRFPEASLGDLRSQLAACRMAERRLQELLKRYGKDTVKEAINQIFDETESRCRAVVQKMADGTYEAESMLDDFSGDGEGPIRIKVKVIIDGSDMTIDLTGCSPQRKDSINSRTLAGPRIAYKNITTPLLPVNEGAFRALKIVIQEGNIMMAKYPAPMSGWSAAIPTVVDTIIRALAPAMPDTIPAGHHCSLGGCIIFFGTDPATGKRFVSQSIEGGGWGGRPWEDGESAAVSICQGDVRNAPIEKIELKWPVLVICRSLRQDSGGPGKFRGGLGIITKAKNLIEGYWNISNRERSTSNGLWGGKQGASLDTSLQLADGTKIEGESIEGRRIAANAVATYFRPGGGGWGDPLERDPKKVQWDAIEEYISVKAAHEEYGVVLNQETLEIDWDSTSKLRDQLRRQKEKS